jgi:hypothetical protein
MKPLVTPIPIMKAHKAIRLALYFVLQQSLLAHGQTISGVVNSYYSVTAINTLSNTLTLNTTTGLTAGSKVLIAQMKGATIDGLNNATFGNISAVNGAGEYEFNYICSINGNNVLLKFQLLNSYDPTQQVQLVSVPVYTSVTVSGTLNASPWDPVAGSGGIVVFEATDTVYLNATIDVSGQGYQGGPLVNYPVPPYNCSWAINVNNYFLSVPPSDAFHTGGKKGEGIAYYILNEEYGMGKQANGGGGGNNNNAGGAGGGNYGAGGSGGTRTHESTFSCHGTNPGIGGLSLSAYGYSVAQNRIFFGGGGGSGHENNGVGLPGGNGGGIVIITAPVITGMGTSILANGVSPVNPTNVPDTAAQGDGGGGGGAGGTIVLNATQILGSIAASANGARGSDASYDINDCTGPGGGGGGGVVWAAGPSFPAAVSPSETGGTNGVVSSTSLIAACQGSANGATGGTIGNSQWGYIAPLGTSPVCTVLAASDLRYFRGVLSAEGAMLSWQIYPNSTTTSFKIERSLDQVSYITLGAVDVTDGNTNFEFADNQQKEGTLYYRLELENLDGTTSYSTIVVLTRNGSSYPQLLNLQPNPVSEELTLTLFNKEATSSELLVFNSYGQRIYQGRYVLNNGYTQIQIPVSALSAGVYFLVIRASSGQTVKRFIKMQNSQ